MSDNGGSTINSDGKWPGGLCGLGGWSSRSVYVCVCREGGGGGLTKELEEVEDSACVKAALNYISNHQSACQQNRTRGLDISPTCTELAQHFTCRAFQLICSCKYTHMCTHSPPSQDAPSERARHKSVCLLLSTPAIMLQKRFVPHSL